MHVQLLTANGVHPVSDGTAGTLVLQGTKKKKGGGGEGEGRGLL